MTLEPDDLSRLVADYARQHNMSEDEAKSTILAGLRRLDDDIKEGLRADVEAGKPAGDARMGLPVKWSDEGYLKDFMRLGPLATSEKYGLAGPKAAAKLARKAGARRANAIDKDPDAYRGLLTVALEEAYRELAEYGQPGNPKVVETQRRIIAQLQELNGVKKAEAGLPEATTIRVEFRPPGHRGDDGYALPAEVVENAEFEVIDAPRDTPGGIGPAPAAGEGDLQ